MTDGPDHDGPAPDVPPGWAPDQPPAYQRHQGSSWASPGGPGETPPPPPPPPPPQGQPYGQSPYGGQPQYGGQPGAYGPYGSYGAYGPGPQGFRPPPQAPRPGIVPLRPLALGDILDGTIKMVRSHPKATLGLSAIVAAVTTLPVSAGQAIYVRSTSELLADPDALGTADALGGLGAQLLGTLISMALTFVATTILTGIMTRVLGRAVFGGKITVGEAWRLTRGRFPALFGLVALEGLILILPALLVFGLAIGLITSGALEDSSGGVVGLVGFLILCLVAYAVYALFFSTKFALSAPAVVLEGRGPVDAMRRSWQLVKGDSWRIFGIVLLTGLLAGLIGSVLSFPFSLAGTMVGLMGGSSAGVAVAVTLLTALGSTLSAMITYPFQAGVNGLLYADRRMRVEAFDLVLRSAAAQNQTQGWVHSSVDDLWDPSNAAAAGAGASAYGPPYGTGPGQDGWGGYGAPPGGPQL
ncbi:glycerophosphoryl diester phosphodiesterase membrane domain-containing protein [Microtetraspora malaysiensis]|uniref:Glycerophosphoryl diester phosphodiesterase membrane domain-containing protein n=1 Tax=Microtetraspora malaysiensis TaxID=161358 RepID=A0ABW6SKQ1_9ACTN